MTWRVYHEVDGLGDPRFYAAGTEIGSPHRRHIRSRVIRHDGHAAVRLATGFWITLDKGADEVARRITDLIASRGINAVA